MRDGKARCTRPAPTGPPSNARNTDGSGTSTAAGARPWEPDPGLLGRRCYMAGGWPFHHVPTALRSIARLTSRTSTSAAA
jgi:hypothetical protein